MPDMFPRIGSAAIVRDGDRILLGRRAKDPGRGNWILPGGKIEPFETIKDAVCRELREETGLEITVDGPIGAFEIVNPPTQHRIILYHWASPVGGTLTPSSDVDELRYVTKEELATMSITGVVAEVLKHVGWL